MVALVLSLIAGMLTVVAPCVLPLLPVIVGGSVASSDRRRPYIVAASLVASLLIFTLLLKATTVLIGIDPAIWTYVSASIVIALGIGMLFPGVWPWLTTKLGIEGRSQTALVKANSGKGGVASAILTGAALGPVFSSCSPTYAWVIATVLPASPAVGFGYLAAYCVGVAASLLAIGLLGRRLLQRIKWFSNPRGWFQRSLGVLFIIVGLGLATGLDKQLQTWAAERVPAGIIAFEEQLIPAVGDGKPALDSESQTDPAGYPAPELAGIGGWINSEPLSLAELRGKVVLIDFWTYSCINCQRTQPFLNAWHDRYADSGLVIIGVHAPEFAFEKVRTNVAAAVASAGIKYPVALDNKFATWNAFQNRYWPAKYLIDGQGQVRYTHFGEGEYAETENVIRELLDESGAGAAVDPESVPGTTTTRSPETYLGTGRAAGYVGTGELRPGESSFSPAASLGRDEWTLGGQWQVGSETITAGQAATLDFRFSGRDAYLVLDGPVGAKVKVALADGSPPGGRDVARGVVTLAGPRLYHLVQLDQPTDGLTLQLSFDAGLKASAFTFG